MYLKKKNPNWKKKYLGVSKIFGEIPDFLIKIRKKNLGVPKKRGYIQFTKEFPFKELFKRNSKKYKLEEKKYEVKKNIVYFFKKKNQNWKKKYLGVSKIFWKNSRFFDKNSKKNLGVPKKRGYIQFTKEFPFKEL